MVRRYVVLALGAAIVWPLLAANATAQDAATSRVTFYKDVLPIFQENCQECHRPVGSNMGGMVAPMSLTTYRETRPWAKAIVQQVTAREMPPWDAAREFHGVFANERSLTDEEIDTIARWVESGAARGNPKDAPDPVEFESENGWVIGNPDLIVEMPEPYYVKDEVEDQYTAFTVDLSDEQLPQDMWITAFQCKPGSPIIHHFNAHLLYPDENGELPPPPESPESSSIAPVGAGQYIGGVASGTDAVQWPEGFGIPLKKGTRVTFDIHYHKEPGAGTGMWDQSHIGFNLTSQPPRREMGGTAPINSFAIKIPPNEPSYKIGPIAQTIKQDIDVISLMPHMHMRGSRAIFEAFYPDGTSEVLLHVPNYDFSWQTVYYYKDMKRIPAGTRIEFTAWYDNSPEMAAIRGFDSNQTVTFGPSSTDEMFMGFIMSAPAEDAEPPSESSD